MTKEKYIMAGITNPVKAIHAFCLDCCGDNRNFVKECTTGKCPLHPFRMGKNPYRAKRELTEEQRAALAAHGFQKRAQ